MEYQKLGRAGFNISRVGFGGLVISGFHYGKTKNQQSIAAVRRALELGVNFFDTADVYGFGHSERILSKGLGKYRKKVVIATKVGVRWDKKGEKSYYDLSPEYISEAVENSLSNLGINNIPLYQIHYPDPKTPISQTMRVLNKLKDEKKIQHIGCSNFTPDLINKYQRYGRIESLQIPYNILDREAEKHLFSTCNKWNMGIIVYSPIAQGLLTGKYDINTKFSDSDRRSQSKYFTKETLSEIMPLLKKMKEIGSHYGKTLTQVAIRWILDNSYVTCAIVGVKTAEEIEEAVGAMNWKLSKKERDELTKIGEKIIS